MSGFETMFFAAIGRYVARETGLSVSSVTRVEQYTERHGYCETCSYEAIVIYITYKVDYEHSSRQFRYSGDMGDFIRALD